MSSAQTNANEALVKVRFFLMPIKDEIASKKAGRYIGHDIEVCEVRFAGNREKVIHAPAHEVFKQERDIEGNVNDVTYALAYNEEYKAFKSGNADIIRGTPTSELPFLTPSQILMLKALNIHTAEALAALDGHSLKQLGMGGRDLKVQAQAYIDRAKGSVDVVQMAAAIEELKAYAKQLEARIPGAAGAAAEGDEDAANEPLRAAEDPSKSPFFSMGADDIKNWIQEATGTRPLGNPSHATLVKRADEVNAEIAAKRSKVA